MKYCYDLFTKACNDLYYGRTSKIRVEGLFIAKFFSPASVALSVLIQEKNLRTDFVDHDHRI